MNIGAILRNLTHFSQIYSVFPETKQNNKYLLVVGREVDTIVVKSSKQATISTSKSSGASPSAGSRCIMISSAGNPPGMSTWISSLFSGLDIL